MFWKWFWKVLALLIVLAIFAGGGFLIYKVGYANGVAAANLDASQAGEVPPRQWMPYADPGFGLLAPYRLFFPGLSLLLGFFLLLLLFGGIGRLAHYSMWRSAGMPDHPHWGPGWHKVRHPRYQGDGPSQGQSGKGDDTPEETDLSG